MLPNVVAQRRDENQIIVRYSEHVIGVLTEHSDHVQVRFRGPTGQQFRLPDTLTVSTGIAALVVAALSYHYRPHEITVHASGDDGFMLWCPTCTGVGVRAERVYPSEQDARSHAVAEHAAVSGHPGTLAERPQALPPDVAPDNALNTDETSAS